MVYPGWCTWWYTGCTHTHHGTRVVWEAGELSSHHGTRVVWEAGELSSPRYPGSMGGWGALFASLSRVMGGWGALFASLSRVLGRLEGCYSPLFPGIREVGRLLFTVIPG